MLRVTNVLVAGVASAAVLTYAQGTVPSQSPEVRLKPDTTSASITRVDGNITPAPPFAPRDLTTFPTTGWPTNGGDLYNRRYSPLSQITRDNVSQLKAVWRTRLGGSGLDLKYSGEAQPIVHDGVIYIITGADDVFAIGVESGEILWTYKANLDQKVNVVCCGWTSRGVGLGDGRIYVGQLDGKLVALDQRSGAVVWSVQAERWQEGFSITSAPLYYDGLVITGFAGAEYGIRGRVKAFRASDGSPAWTFYTIPGPGELGHDTWPKNSDVWQHGGASVWQTPAVDPELGLLYFSTGNPGPDFNGAVRAGDNLFSASIVAVDAKTGRYRWHFQQVHHDIWDFDAPSPVVLFDIEIGGRTRKALAQPSKTGWVYILDRTNGRPLIGIEERPVPQEPRQATARTQPFPVGRRVRPAVDDHGARRIPARQSGTDLHAVLDRPDRGEAGAGRRRQLAAQLLRSTQRLPVRLCIRPHGRLQGGRQRFRPAHGWRTIHRRRVRLRRMGHHRRVLSARHAHEQAGLAAAVAGALLQRIGGHCRRSGIHRPGRWTAAPRSTRVTARCCGTSRRAPA